ncbi:MAG: ADP-ribosylation factor-like protein [Promethearchaeota archaeon]
MENLLKNSLIKGIVFSAYDRFGPQPIYMFPLNVSEEEAGDALRQPGEDLRISIRDYMQISIKNLGLLLGNHKTDFDDPSLDEKYFGILPYPDFKLTSLSFFHYLKTNFADYPLPSSLAILVDEKHRTYLYNNVNRIKPLVEDFLRNLDQKIRDGYKKREDVEPLFIELLEHLIQFEKEPYTPVATQRKMKILFTGLDDSGKTSFLLSVNRKYSKLMGLKPTRGVSVKSIDALGATIFLWDLGGQSASREKYLNKAQIYLYEADLLFYFIDIRNKARFQESFKYFNQIIDRIEGFSQRTPMIFIFSKADPDILESSEIQENIKYVKSQLKGLLLQEKLAIYITSIFSIFSVLRAFSSGISKLSPNRKLINRNLKDYFLKAGSHLTLLLTTEGLVLADYYTKDSSLLTEFPEADQEDIEGVNIRNIFEVTAPQFIMLYKIFTKFKTLQEEEALFKVADSIIFFKMAKIAEHDMFFLFVTNNEKNKDIIKHNIPEFLKKTEDLLLRYLA